MAVIAIIFIYAVITRKQESDPNIGYKTYYEKLPNVKSLNILMQNDV